MERPRRFASARIVPALLAAALCPLCAAAVGCGGEAAQGASATAPPSPPPSASASVAASAPAPAVATPPAPSAAATSSAPASEPAAASPSGAQGAELAEGDEHRERHHGVVMLVAMSIKDLDLSPDQRAALEEIRTDLVAKLEPARRAGKELADVLADGVAAGRMDRAKVDPAVAKLATQVRAVQDASVAALDKLHAALKPEQRAALVDDLRAHWEKWKEAHGRDEEDSPQHRAGYLLALVRDLHLTKEEADKIKSSFHERMKAAPQDHAHKPVEDYIQAFSTAFKGETFNAKTLAGARDANERMARWGATRRARFLEAAAPVLTPEQRAKLAAEIRDRAARAKP